MLLSPPPLLSACNDGSAVSSALAAALQFFAAAQCLVHEPWPPHTALANGTSFDFIIVGGGTAGSVLAARLTEEEGFRVLLIEAGGDPPQESIIPAFRDVLKGSPYDWNFTTVNDHFSSQALIGGKQRQPRGKMLGGSGSLNDMVYARGFPIDYEEWASYLGEEWNWSNVLKYFKKTEHMTDENIINDPELMKYHGRGGANEVTGSKESTFETDKFLEAFKELGFKMVQDLTYPEAIGAGRFSHTIKGGRRDSSATGLLNDAAERSNLLVLKDALVTQILIHNKTAYGVRVILNNKELHFNASKEVIISAGTFNTPKLLLLSGIGPKDHLKSLGIEVVQDSAVGDNLHDHIMVMNYLAAENGTCYTDAAAGYMNLIQYLYDRTGPLSKSNSMGAYLSFNSSQANVPDFAFYPICIPRNSQFYKGCVSVLGYKAKICAKLDEVNKNQEILSVAVVLLKPKSRGKVRLSSSNPFDTPKISSGTFGNFEDLDNFPEAIDIVRSIAGTTYFKSKKARFIEFDLDSCHGTMGRQAVKCKARAMAMSAWHSVGTAAMGTVVDSKLKVNGVARLRVVDASVMPKVVRGNTNAVVVMIAEQAADFIKDEYRRV